MATPNVIETINTGVATNKGLVVQGSGGQSADLQEWQDTNGNVLFAVGPNGALNLFGTGTNGQMLALQSLTELTHITSSMTNTNLQVPANAVILGVSVFVYTAVPGGATNFTAQVTNPMNTTFSVTPGGYQRPSRGPPTPERPRERSITLPRNASS